MHDVVSPTPKRLPWFPWVGKKKPFFGWVIVGSGTATQFAQGVAMQGSPTYLTYLQRDFGWTKTVLSGARSLQQVEASLLGPLQGFLVDRYGPRVVSLIGTFILSLGLILFGTTHSLWMYYFSNVIMALGSGLISLMTVSIAVNAWFQRKRTVAQAFVASGMALAGVVAVPIVVALQTSLGWQNAAYISGIFTLVIGVPCSMYLLHRPEPYGLLPDGVLRNVAPQTGKINQYHNNDYHFTLKEAMRTRAFWLLGISNALGMAGMAGVQIHIFLHLEEGVKLAPEMAALIWSIVCITNIPSRIIGGIWGDRTPKFVVLGLSTLIVGVAVFILGVSHSETMAIVFALLYGIGWGCRTPVIFAIQGECFGVKSLGVIGGWLAVLGLPFSIVAPVLVGYLADVQGDYRVAFIIMSLVIAVGGILAFIARIPERPQEQPVA